MKLRVERFALQQEWLQAGHNGPQYRQAPRPVSVWRGVLA